MKFKMPELVEGLIFELENTINKWEIHKQSG